MTDRLRLIAVVAAPALAAFLGASGPASIRLNLGPGDSPYIQGFTPEYEIDERVATHWTGYDAQVSLPLALSGQVQLAYRYARILPETAQVDVLLDGRPVDHFACRGGRFETRSVSAGALPATPARLRFEIDSHDRRNLGLKLDFVRFDVGARGRTALYGAARWRPALVIALLFFLLRLAGYSLNAAAGFAALPALAVSLALIFDPWLVHRLSTGVPETLALIGVPAILVARTLAERGRIESASLRGVVPLALAAFVLRAAALNHPDFYYPDLRSHARYAQGFGEMGLAALARPAALVRDFGIWKSESGGREIVYPYPPTFHAAFALAPGLDAAMTRMKLGAAALSVVPLVVVWALASRLGASRLGALLMLLVPTYTSRLSFGFLPALFGHALDIAFIYWLSSRLPAIEGRRALVVGALFVTCCQLGYVSGVINVSVFTGVLALLAALEPPSSIRRGARILAIGLVGSLLSVALYYRDFMPTLGELLAWPTAGATATSRYPSQPFVDVAVARTHGFFGGVYPVLTLVGLGLLIVRGRGRSLLLAWTVTYLLLLLGRASVPDVFLHGHETLFVTPLVCLVSGEALTALWKTGRFGRVAATSVLVFLAYQGLQLQWQAVAAQLGNAL